MYRVIDWGLEGVYLVYFVGVVDGVVIMGDVVGKCEKVNKGS